MSIWNVVIIANQVIIRLPRTPATLNEALLAEQQLGYHEAILQSTRQENLGSFPFGQYGAIFAFCINPGFLLRQRRKAKIISIFFQSPISSVFVRCLCPYSQQKLCTLRIKVLATPWKRRYGLWWSCQDF